MERPLVHTKKPNESACLLLRGSVCLLLTHGEESREVGQSYLGASVSFVHNVQSCQSPQCAEHDEATRADQERGVGAGNQQADACRHTGC
jgi:hypothetical protein